MITEGPARITVGLSGRHLQIPSSTEEAWVRRLCQSAADAGSGNGRKAQNDSEHCDSDSSHVISPNSATTLPGPTAKSDRNSVAGENLTHNLLSRSGVSHMAGLWGAAQGAQSAAAIARTCYPPRRLPGGRIGVKPSACSAIENCRADMRARKRAFSSSAMAFQAKPLASRGRRSRIPLIHLPDGRLRNIGQNISS